MSKQTNKQQQQQPPPPPPPDKNRAHTLRDALFQYSLHLCGAPESGSCF